MSLIDEFSRTRGIPNATRYEDTISGKIGALVPGICQWMDLNVAHELIYQELTRLKEIEKKYLELTK